MDGEGIAGNRLSVVVLPRVSAANSDRDHMEDLY